VLTDVCYRLFGTVRGERPSSGSNPRHHLKDLFERRLKRGQCHSTPHFGWSELTCAYWGPPRLGVTEIDTAIDLDLPSMLVTTFDRAQNGSYSPSFAQDLRVRGGVLVYPDPGDWAAEA
jgi:CRISPR-associated protein Cas5d